MISRQVIIFRYLFGLCNKYYTYGIIVFFGEVVIYILGGETGSAPYHDTNSLNDDLN